MAALFGEVPPPDPFSAPPLPVVHSEPLADITQNPSFVLQAVKRVAFENRPIPALTSLTDVRVKIDVTGICGSDVHYWQHGAIGPFVLEAPMVLGHESAGTVVAVGAAVTALRVGDRVALEPGVPCRLCGQCKGGAYNLCGAMRFAATPPHDGTLARFFVLPADLCVPLPPHVTSAEGALAEPLAVAVHVCRQARVRHGSRVVIFGAGPVGLLCTAVARAFGARAAVAVDVNPLRLAFAAAYAATGVYDARDARDAAATAAAIVSQQCAGEPADVAIDASGAESCIQTAVHVLRRGGTLVQAGMGRDLVAFPIVAVTAKELTVRGSFRYAHGDYALAVDLIASGQVDVKKLVTSRFAFGDAERAFEETLRGTGLKVLIEGPETRQCEMQ